MCLVDITGVVDSVFGCCRTFHLRCFVVVDP